MIANNTYNRTVIAEYLNTISEDLFIDEVIIPLFSKSGYLLYRRNIHGPGEHGKDLVLYRHVKLFYDNEYIVVQAKAEKVNASNVSKFADQLTRALKVPFPGKSKGQIHPNYVVFINSHSHSNDANFEFHYLTDMKDNIKILSRENIIELIIEMDIVPESLKEKIELYEGSKVIVNPNMADSYDEYVRSIILGDDNIEINKLLDHDLKIDTRPLSSEIKELIINYIFNKWSQDPSWEGRIKPLKWLRYYFDYIQENQSSKLLRVIEEYISSTPSFKAADDTAGIISKITPNQIKHFEQKFIEIIAQETRNNSIKKHPLLKEKFNEFITSGLISETYNTVKDKIIKYSETREAIMKTTNEEQKKSLSNILSQLSNELYYFLYPDERSELQ